MDMIGGSLFCCHSCQCNEIFNCPNGCLACDDEELALCHNEGYISFWGTIGHNILNLFSDIANLSPSFLFRLFFNTDILILILVLSSISFRIFLLCVLFIMFNV